MGPFTSWRGAARKYISFARFLGVILVVIGPLQWSLEDRDNPLIPFGIPCIFFIYECLTWATGLNLRNIPYLVDWEDIKICGPNLFKQAHPTPHIVLVVGLDQERFWILIGNSRLTSQVSQSQLRCKVIWRLICLHSQYIGQSHHNTCSFVSLLTTSLAIYHTNIGVQAKRATT